MGSSSDGDNFCFVLSCSLDMLSYTPCSSCRCTARQCCRRTQRIVNIAHIHRQIVIHLNTMGAEQLKSVRILMRVSTCIASHWFGVASVFAIKLFISIISQDNCAESMEYSVIVCYCALTPWKNSITASPSTDRKIKYDNYYFQLRGILCEIELMPLQQRTHTHAHTTGNFNCVHSMCGNRRW